MESGSTTVEDSMTQLLGENGPEGPEGGGRERTGAISLFEFADILLKRWRLVGGLPAFGVIADQTPDPKPLHWAVTPH